MASDLSLFLKKNKKTRENAFYPATKSLCDADGNPLMWEIRPVSITEFEQIQEKFTREAPVPGKKGRFRTKLDSGYMAAMMVAAIVSPNLYDAALQDSYGVKTPEDLLKAMVDSPGEFADFAAFVQKQSGFDEDMADEVDEAKN